MEPLLQQQAALLPLGAGGVGPLAAGPVTRQGGPLHPVTRVTLKHVMFVTFLNIPYGQSSAKLPVTQSFSHSVT